MFTGLQRAVDEFEGRCIAYALENHGGNITRAAITLRLSRQSLQRKMIRLGIESAKSR